MSNEDQSVEPFTEEEKTLIAKYLIGFPRAHFLFDHGAYIVPSVLFACYGVWAHDLVATFVGYLALLIVVVLYLNRQHRYRKLFYSAIKKYEARVGAITMPKVTHTAAQRKRVL